MGTTYFRPKYHPMALTAIMAAVYAAFGLVSEVLSDLGYLAGYFSAAMAGTTLYDAALASGFILFAAALIKKEQGRGLLLTAGIMLTAGFALQMIVDFLYTLSYSSYYYASGFTVFMILLGGLMKTAASAMLLILIIRRRRNGYAPLKREIRMPFSIIIPALALVGSVIFTVSTTSAWVGYEFMSFFETLSDFFTTPTVTVFFGSAAIYMTGLLDINMRVLKGDQPGADTSDMSLPMAAHVLLLLFTNGIWAYVSIFRITEYLNIVEGHPKMRPVCQVLLNLIPFYCIYWVYRQSLRTDQLARERGMRSDTMLPCILLSIFISLLMTIPLQSKFSQIAGARPGSQAGYQAPQQPQTNFRPQQAQAPQQPQMNFQPQQAQAPQQPQTNFQPQQAQAPQQPQMNFQPQQAQAPQQPQMNFQPQQAQAPQQPQMNFQPQQAQAPQQPQMNFQPQQAQAPQQPQSAEIVSDDAFEKNMHELKQYKELLDMGIITKEEFDQKKKALLGL